jgi:hypothetical protein
MFDSIYQSLNYFHLVVNARNTTLDSVVELIHELEPLYVTVTDAEKFKRNMAANATSGGTNCYA